MPTFKRATTAIKATKADLLVVGCYEGNVLSDEAKVLDKTLSGAITKHLARARTLGFAARQPFKGQIRHATTVSTLGKIAAPEVMIVGLGKQQRSTENIRKAAGAAARYSNGYSSVALALPEGPGSTQAAVEGFHLGSYAFTGYFSAQPKRTSRVAVIGASNAEIATGVAMADATAWARDLVNEPPSDRSPEAFAERVADRAKGTGVKVEILTEKNMAERGMNGILTVGRGSVNPPRFVTLTYEPKGAKAFVGAIGKGITFDSGGLSLKPAASMETMKMDCTGAAAVASAILSLPYFAPGIKVVGAIALAENMPGGRAVKPGDVIRHYGGRTSEVLNTDAEGRLVLADALAWMVEQRPDAMVDLATLTGGMMVALGPKYAGYFSNRADLALQLQISSDKTGEPLWQMPLIDEYRENIDSIIADIKNTAGTTYGSPIYGALFLKDFVGDVPWAHIDIAGPAWSEKGEHFLPAGATGFGARLLIDWIGQRAATAEGRDRG
ncbi:MAG: leucyl aminopeptidase [Actinomycetota bacterium]|nr:leucyl aminopeptidase [Actinomycetota bacterium]